MGIIGRKEKEDKIMVSIAGIIHPSAFQVNELIGTMTPAFSHACPTPFQHVRHKNLEMGIWGGLAATNDRKNYWAMLDGTILNAHELRSDLKKQGFQFRTEHDTEIIIHAYDAWEEDFVEKLNGPFAIALYDEEKQHLFLIGDRLGQKNLYWTTVGDYFFFSTELKGLLSTGIVPQTPSVDGLSSYLTFGYIPQDFSAIRGVNKLLPGHYVQIDANRRTNVSQYWSYSAHLEAKVETTPEKAAEELTHHLEKAISFCDPANSPLILTPDLGGQTLSHFCPTAQTLNPTLDTLESEELLQSLIENVWFCDEPIADIEAVAAWHFAKQAEGSVDRVISTLGWTELFAGNSRYFLTPESKKSSFAHTLAHLPPTLRSIALTLLNQSRTKFRVLRNLDIDQSQLAYLSNIALFSNGARKKVSPELYPYFDPEVFTQRFHRLSSVLGDVEPFLYFDAKTQLPDSRLLSFERLFSSHAISLMTPFLDHHLVEFIAHLPESIKFPDNRPAALLEDLLSTPFQPAPTPPHIEKWRHDPHFRHTFSLLATGLLANEGLISPKWIHHELGYPHLTPLAFRRFWSLLVLEIWFRININRPIRSLALDTPLTELLAL